MTVFSWSTAVNRVRTDIVESLREDDTVWLEHTVFDQTGRDLRRSTVLVRLGEVRL